MRKAQHRRDAFSLLEVILALAILTGAIAALGEAVRMGMRNAQVARDATRAQLLCESKMAEISSGFTPPTSVSGAAFESMETLGQTPMADLDLWTYSVATETLDEDGLMEITVTVTQDPAKALRPVQFKLVRWMIDPTIVEVSETVETEEGI